MNYMIGEEAKRLATVTRFMLLLITSTLFLRLFLQGETLVVTSFFLPFVASIAISSSDTYSPHSFYFSIRHILYVVNLIISLYIFLFILFDGNATLALFMPLTTALRQNLIFSSLIFASILTYEIGFRNYIFNILYARYTYLTPYYISTLEIIWISTLIIGGNLHLDSLIRLLSLIFFQSLTLNLLRNASWSVFPGVALRLLFYGYGSYIILSGQITYANISVDENNFATEAFFRYEFIYYFIVLAIFLQVYTAYKKYNSMLLERPISQSRHPVFEFIATTFALYFLLVLFAMIIPLFFAGIFIFSNLSI